MYKISLIEFIAVPAKAKVHVVYHELKQQRSGAIMMEESVNAEGFIGLRKL